MKICSSVALYRAVTAIISMLYVSIHYVKLYVNMSYHMTLMFRARHETHSLACDISIYNLFVYM